MPRLLPELTPWHRTAALFLLSCFVAGAAVGVLAAIVERRLRHG